MHVLLCVRRRCAAVLCVDGRVYYTDGKPADQIVDRFTKRADNQITTLEILAISVGLSSFDDLLLGRKVIVFSDNTGAEATVRKGSSRAWDQSKLIHEIWSLALLLKLHIWIERVPSDDNISDDPSREAYELLDAPRPRGLGASWRPARLAKIFLGGTSLADACV